MLLAVVAAVMALDTLLYGVGVPILSLQAARGGLDLSDTGLLFATFAGAQVVALVWALRYSSRVAPQRILWAGFAIVVAAMLTFALSTEGVVGLFAGRALHGLASALVWVGGPALVCRSYPDDERGAALGTVLGASAGGSLIGPLMGGALHDAAGFGAPHWAATGLALLVLLFIGLALRGPVGAAISGVKSSDEPDAGLGRLIARPEVLAVLLVVACAAAGLGLLEPLLPAVLADTLQSTGFENGIIFGVAILSYGLTAPLAGRLSDRLGRLPVCLVGLGLLALCFVLLPVGDSRVTLGAIAALAGVGLGLGLVPTMPALAEAAEQVGDGPVSYAAVFALHSVFYAAGAVAGPGLGGYGVEHHGLAPTVAVACALIVAAAVAAGLLGHRGRRARPRRHARRGRSPGPP